MSEDKIKMYTSYTKTELHDLFLDHHTMDDENKVHYHPEGGVVHDDSPMGKPVLSTFTKYWREYCPEVENEPWHICKCMPCYKADR